MNDNEQRLSIRLMEAQIDRVRQEMRFEVYKALAAILGSAAAIAAAGAGIAALIIHWHG
jgi:hypothetical protein